MNVSLTVSNVRRDMAKKKMKKGEKKKSFNCENQPPNPQLKPKYGKKTHWVVKIGPNVGKIQSQNWQKPTLELKTLMLKCGEVRAQKL